MTLGLVCDSCDALSPLSATVCPACKASLGILPAARFSPSQPATQGRQCPYCNAEVAAQHRFCGSCGKPVAATSAAAPPASAAPAPEPELRKPGAAAKTMFFGAMQASRAKLILIKGEGMDGVSYMLTGTDHVAGRLEGQILFPEDPLLSPRHANFLYRDGKLFVSDEDSANGVFVRILRPQTVSSGATFLVGEQLMRIEACPADGAPVPDAEGTYFYGSPKRTARMQLVQLLAGGHPGQIYRAREDRLTLGREGNDINFPEDPFISGRHATVSVVDAPSPSGIHFQITDQGSKNGTFLRVLDETQLAHGDYVFIGQQLLRVEIT